MFTPERIAQFFGLVAKSPEVAICLAFAFIGLGWWIGRTLSASRISDLEERIRLRDDELSKYKKQLDGATPDQAAERIAALEVQVAELSAPSENALFQAGSEVGVGFEAVHDDPNAKFTFGYLYVDRVFDVKREFVFRGLILRLTAWSSEEVVKALGDGARLIHHAVAEVLGVA